MIPLYVFSLVLGGGFLGLSLLGDIFGAHGGVDLSGGHGDLSLGAGAGDLDTEVHLEADVHTDVDVHAESGGEVAHDGASHAAAKIFSIRTITYSLFGFGAVGTALTVFSPGIAPATTAVLAAATGLASGAIINTLFAWVKRGDSGALTEEAGYAGRLGRVTLPIEGSGGKIMVEVAGREVELTALPHASATAVGEASGWRRVLIVEMNHGVALVVPAEDDTYLTP